jgi:hypothetical protein
MKNRTWIIPTHLNCRCQLKTTAKSDPLLLECDCSINPLVNVMAILCWKDPLNSSTTLLKYATKSDAKSRLNASFNHQPRPMVGPFECDYHLLLVSTFWGIQNHSCAHSILAHHSREGVIKGRKRKRKKKKGLKIGIPPTLEFLICFWNHRNECQEFDLGGSVWILWERSMTPTKGLAWMGDALVFKAKPKTWM